MADPLSILLNLQSPSNRTPGGGGGVPLPPTTVQTPLRNNAKAAALAKFLGIPDDTQYRESDMQSAFDEIQAEQAATARAEAEAKTLPERVKGEYGLETERLHGKSALEVAQAQREAAALERQTGREFTAGQNELNRNAMDQRNRTTQAGITGRTSQLEAGRNSRQRAGQAESQAKLLESGKTEPQYPPTNGFLDSVKSFLGLGPYDRNTAARNQASQLRSQALTSASAEPGGDVQGIAQQYLQQYGHLSDDELRQTIMQNEPEADPQELQQLFDVIGQLRGAR